MNFSDCCRKGTISNICRGLGRTIKGKKEKKKSYEIECIEFKEQSVIGVVEIDLSTRTCVLIKLARMHPAVDFIIYRSEGSVGTRTLYLVQVSSSPYQSRPKGKKLDAVHDLSISTNISVYAHYHSMFKIKGAEVFYVYSSPANIPSNASFSTDPKEKNCVYFHQL